MTHNSESRDGEGRYAWAASTTQPMPGQGATQQRAPLSGASAPTTPVNQAAAPPAFPTTTSYPGGSGAYPYSGSAGHAGQQPGYTGTPPTGGFPAGPGQFPPAPPGGGHDGSRRNRGPGWIGVGAVGITAAVLSSLLTVGLVNATDDDTTTATTPTSTQTEQTVPGPVTNSSSSSPDWEAVANAVEPSVVAVKVTSQQGSGEGSGVILNKNGEILTNNHVVAGANQVEVDLSDGRGYTAKVVGTDPSTDLAVIKIQSPPANLKPATIGSSGAVKVGDHVMAVGNPLGLAGTVTTGIVSALDRPVTTQAEEQETGNPFAQQQQSDDTVITNAIQTDAAVNPGNSGGALVDAQGRVIGINSSIASLGSGSISGSQSGSIGLGFAIPIDEAKYVASQLSDGGSIAHAFLGVSSEDGEVTVDGAKREAAMLKEITGNSPASKAGLKEGDAVVGVDGDAVNSSTSLVGQIRERRPGAAVTLTVIRDGKSIDVKATLGTK